ncbi:MAG: response regulator [Candidatus Sumerlaeaceae bacterium]|nr:response regulator [Candidatus Sumerlaeaceae bacterium]
MSEKKKILAVDDESDLLLIIKTALFSEGFDVITASNGPDGLALAEDQKPDLLILDMMMPEMNGFEVLKCMRDNPKTQDIPVIMLTGVSEKSKIRQALDSGIDYYIVKPFEFHDLISKVKIALEGGGPALP